MEIKIVDFEEKSRLGFFPGLRVAEMNNTNKMSRKQWVGAARRGLATSVSVENLSR